MNNTLTNRHDLLVLFDVTNGNPNGDPDAGNMPRIEPNTNKGLISDVCLKRKIRNYILDFVHDPESQDGYDILIRQGIVLETAIKEGEKIAKNNAEIQGSSDAEKTKNWLCQSFFDVRAFGGVLSVGTETMKGSAFGQVRGPVQFTFAQSIDPITPLEISITRCAVTKEADKEKERTMGNKHIVPYGLYLAKGYVSPAFAKNTGFSQIDYDYFIKALMGMFENDHSAARGEMIVRALYDFEHVGTQGEQNSAQNAVEARLGCAQSHKLFETVEVALKNGATFPSSFQDYSVSCSFDRTDFPGVKLHRRIDPTV